MLRDEFDDAALRLGDVALGLELRRFGSRCHRYLQDTHHHYFCERSLMFCHNHEAITTPSPLPGQAALRGKSGCSTRKALPWQIKAKVFCAIHDTTTLLNDDAVWLSLLQVLGVGASSQDTWQFQTFFPCVSVSNPWLDRGAALVLGFCAATAQRGHRCCRSECCKRSLQDVIVCAFFCGRWFCSSRWDGGCCAWAAALGLLRWAPFTVGGQLLCGSQDTHATFSPSLRCVSFVIEAVCSMACSVLARVTMFWIFFLAEFWVLFASRCSTARQSHSWRFHIHCWSVLIFLLPRSISRAQIFF